MPGYIIKVAGPLNRHHNWLAYNDFKMGTRMPEDDTDWDTIASNVPQYTYQTVSAAAYYSTYQQAEQEHQWDQIIVPKTYLFHVPGAAVTPVCDQNYVLVQEKLDCKPIRIKEYNNEQEQRIERIMPVFKDVTPRAFKQFLEFVIAVGIWDPKPNIHMNNEGKLVYFDLEQPNNWGPQYFFGKNKKDMQRSIFNGLAGLIGGRFIPGYLGESLLQLAYDQGFQDHANELYKIGREFVLNNEQLETVIGPSLYEELCELVSEEQLTD